MELADPRSPDNPPLDVLVSGLASDAHTWNLVYLQLFLEERGHRVRNLGACVPDDMLVEQCLRHDPDLVVLGSVNGHGWQDGERVVRALRARPELAATAVVIGGKLGIDGPRGDSQADRLRAAGVDEVFEDHGGIAPFRSYVDRLAARVRA
ncbi:cobalamin B12-binding domain-containing protein [Kutzneria sp. NPDC052558]|uniref:cobalamin B12-binding domain-containing protein n=1 Tax=Kutzneria sp. NPDC052558 TaxID=3364121 RepID=UPI0037C53DF9